MFNKKIVFLIAMFCASCGSGEIVTLSTPTPNFVTATLPSTIAPLPSQTALPPTLVPTSNPIQGNTTTQVNVRKQTNTASDTLGVIPAFSNLQIIGKESTGNWYQVVYEGQAGWVRTEFVQVDDSVEIQVVGLETATPVGMSGVVKSGINVRSGAGKDFESIGVLTQKDVVWITAKNEGNAWAQIEFNGKVGWVALEFLETDAIDNLPVVAENIVEVTPSLTVENPVVVVQVAYQDNDTMQTPFAKTFFTEAKIFQITNDVSTPQGDFEDWIEFSSYTSKTVIEISCSGSGLQLELWQAGEVKEELSNPCGNVYFLDIEVNKSYFLRIFQPTSNDAVYASYLIKLSAN